MNSIVVHYKELALKGKNRPWFIQHLVRNLRDALAGLDVKSVRSVMGRIEIDLGARAPMGRGERPHPARVRHRELLVRRPRLARLHATWRQPSSPMSATGGPRRSACPPADRTSGLPFTSPQIEYEVGGLIQEANGWRVDLERAALTIHIEMMPDHAFYFFGKEPGAGGLPTGTGGRVACLLSGGIDSPVAAYRMMRRGCTVLLIHFHSYPILSRASQEKVREIAALLTTSSAALAAGAGPVRRAAAAGRARRAARAARRDLPAADAAHRRAAGARWRAHALVTGEVVGQVASQTLENMTAIAQATTLEILRPLVGMDKDEIIAEAQRLGTFPISIIPDQDCCQLFTPKHPATRVRREQIELAERALPIEEMVDAAVAAAAVEEFRFPVLEYAAAQRASEETAVMTFEPSKRCWMPSSRRPPC